MSQTQIQQAVDLYKSGDRLGAETILKQIVQTEPENVEAWYGLAMCAHSDAEKEERLQKCLAIQPDHANAKKAYTKLLEKKRSETPQDPSSVMDSTSRDNMRQETPKETIHKDTLSVLTKIYFPIIVILIGLIIWQFIRIDRLEKNLVNLQKSQVNLENSQGSIKQDINSLANDISNLASGLNYVTPLAENANRYAHSHTYSDRRLKTGVSEISDPVEKISKIRGVYYEWNTDDFPQFGFDGSRQIGVIAQEVESVFPELVTIDENGYKQVDYERLSAVLIEAVNEQQKEIEDLNLRLEQIETR